ncbi:hypothetical protein EA716_02310 [Acinetobacter baumannii]|uniref:hypothetical protein n=1 Tax=Acinetobacter baumannii TaxID=470 RepID=UPI000F742030|nr:hypothetical protein [Acinetobacter baumannii]RSP97641.1 hypothetical protein EA716_02310 [Acinetobacter baumannii]
MKATQFIKDAGIQRAREVVEGAPEWANHFNPKIGYTKPSENSGEFTKYLDMKTARFEYSINHELGFDLVILKRLVESVDQINAFDGGIKEAKELLGRINKDGSKYATLFERPALEQDIRNYESIYGEVNE